ncbi:MAG: glycosyltransferase [Betaproteobacteria bacterium]|nr:glycosyltransferase [Betaproteobacteria bacterium]
MEVIGRKKLLVEGWTGINHSYAMVNQYQLLQFLKSNQIETFHREAPYFNSSWSKDNIGAGFPPADAIQLANLAAYTGEPLDGVYRIHAPASLETTTDADFGFPSELVYVVPHGVDAERFYPLSPEARQAARTTLGYHDDHVVLLNVGAPIWNKGLDLVLESFLIARQKNKNLRLLVKDQQALYGVSAVKMLQDMVAQGRVQPSEDDVAAISIISQSLSVAQLRELYGLADYYFSPYRAEGFNLPVIESIACGTPVLVTSGGSTDDFCDSNTSVRIPSTLARNLVIGDKTLAACLMPNMDAMINMLGQCARGELGLRSRIGFGRADLLSRFPWRRATDLITALL